VTETAFAIPENAVDFWTRRLTQQSIAFRGPFERFGENVISFSDPDGMGVELVATKTTRDDRAFQAGPVPLEFAIRGFHSATLFQNDHRETSRLLTDTMGFKLVAQEGDRFRYAADSNEAAGLVDILRAPDQRPGRVLVGTVHHIAWRTGDDAQQRNWLAELSRLNYDVSPVMDRKYFRSIYYREPGGILFEIATDPPGFFVDETPEALGTKLVLPPWLEPERARLEAILPPLRLPVAQEVTV
jgi:glyoxalase family protein